MVTCDSSNAYCQTQVFLDVSQAMHRTMRAQQPLLQLPGSLQTATRPRILSRKHRRKSSKLLHRHLKSQQLWQAQQGRAGVVGALPLLIRACTLEPLRFQIQPAWECLSLSLTCRLPRAASSQRLQPHMAKLQARLQQQSRQEPSARHQQSLQVCLKKQQQQARRLCLESLTRERLLPVWCLRPGKPRRQIQWWISQWRPPRQVGTPGCSRLRSPQSHRVRQFVCMVNAMVNDDCYGHVALSAQLHELLHEAR